MPVSQRNLALLSSDQSVAPSISPSVRVVRRRRILVWTGWLLLKLSLIVISDSCEHVKTTKTTNFDDDGDAAAASADGATQ